VLIMTSNVGARQMKTGPGLGFATGETSNYQDLSSKVKEEMKKTFNPEFLNRIDEIIIFKPLGRVEMSQILRIMTLDLEQRLRDLDLVRVQRCAREFFIGRASTRRSLCPLRCHQTTSRIRCRRRCCSGRSPWAPA
jgi:ATP-dependent Clp protease ATP-binding subunit ClpC